MYVHIAQPSNIDLLEAGDPAAVVQQHVAALVDARGDLLAEVGGKPIEQDDDGLLCPSGPRQCPLKKRHYVLGAVGAPLLRLQEEPRWRGQAA